MILHRDTLVCFILCQSVQLWCQRLALFQSHLHQFQFRLIAGEENCLKNCTRNLLPQDCISKKLMRAESSRTAWLKKLLPLQDTVSTAIVTKILHLFKITFPTLVFSSSLASCSHSAFKTSNKEVAVLRKLNASTHVSTKTFDKNIKICWFYKSPVLLNIESSSTSYYYQLAWCKFLVST